MAREDAALLIKDLKAALIENRPSADALTPPSLTDDGYLTQTAYCDFFEQINLDEAIRGRVRMIFVRLVAQGKNHAANLEVRCRICKGKTNEPCTAEPPVNHRIHFEMLEINAASLVRLNSREISSINGVGPKFLSDIKVLQRALMKNEE